MQHGWIVQAQTSEGVYNAEWVKGDNLTLRQTVEWLRDEFPPLSVTKVHIKPLLVTPMEAYYGRRFWFSEGQSPSN